jgi:hypothetical protein
VKTNIFNTENYTIESYGNGWAYCVTCRHTGNSFYAQDESALKLQADTSDFADEYAINEYMEILGAEL